MRSVQLHTLPSTTDLANLSLYLQGKGIGELTLSNDPRRALKQRVAMKISGGHSMGTMELDSLPGHSPRAECDRLAQDSFLLQHLLSSRADMADAGSHLRFQNVR